MSAPTTGRRSAGAAKPESVYDFKRLELAVAALAARKQQLESEHLDLRRTLEDREQTIRALELQILELSQRRENALERLDELIERVEGLEVRLEPVER